VQGPEFQAKKNKNSFPVMVKIRTSGYQTIMTNIYFFGFKRCDSVTQILFNLSLPSFDTLLHNSRVIFFMRGVNATKYACLTYAADLAM